MKRIFYLFFAAVCLLMSGCGTNKTSYQNSNNNTNVVIQDSHFRYVKKVKGECNQMYVFGAGILDKGALVNNAIQDMYDKAKLKDGQVIINITTTVSKKIYFPLIATKRFATAYGMVIEFPKDKEVAGQKGKQYDNWERQQRQQNERVSAEPDKSDNQTASSSTANESTTNEPAKTMTYPTTDKYTFTVGEGKKVVFAPGNLQYDAEEKTWQFASSQYAALGNKNDKNHVIDLFCWGTGDRPTVFTKFATDFSNYQEWGRNAIANGGNNQWRTLTSNEWWHLLYKRDEAKARFTLATVNGVAGMLILPDNSKLPVKNRFIAGKEGTKASDNSFTDSQWKKMEEKGCVFLPMTGYSDNGKINKSETAGYYWSASSGTALSFGKEYIYGRSTTPTNRGCAVRLVREAK
ncbi:MAG: hypothetical protein K5660_05415 [Paludibacteraceae bacterium]|nr:hypothetical protein [Paludibacteraceae bacterium]